MTSPHTTQALEASDLDSAIEAVRAGGLRVSTARRLLLEQLWETSEPQTAEQLSDAIGESSDVASVYRNLEALEKLGLIRHFHLGHGPGLYARSSLGRREYLICDACGAHRSVDPARLDEVRELIRNDFGHEASFTHFPIAGLCPECAPGAAARRRPHELRVPLRPRRAPGRVPHPPVRGSAAAGRPRDRLPARPAPRIGPDHLVAVTSLVASEDSDHRDAARLGAWWGLGHATMLLAIGLPLIFLKSELPAWLESAAEKAVGVVILVLAFGVIWKWAHGDYRAGAHGHDGPRPSPPPHRRPARPPGGPHAGPGVRDRRRSTASPAPARWCCS